MGLFGSSKSSTAVTNISEDRRVGAGDGSIIVGDGTLNMTDHGAINQVLALAGQVISDNKLVNEQSIKNANALATTSLQAYEQVSRNDSTLVLQSLIKWGAGAAAIYAVAKGVKFS